jgi:hypothetical protein
MELITPEEYREMIAIDEPDMSDEALIQVFNRKAEACAESNEPVVYITADSVAGRANAEKLEKLLYDEGWGVSLVLLFDNRYAVKAYPKMRLRDHIKRWWLNR